MIVVSDTTPLRYLTLLGHVDLLRRLFGVVHCPDVVLRECRHDSAPSALKQWVELPPEWLIIEKVEEIDSDFRFLDDGEAAALTLCKRIGAVLVLMDERDGRRCACACGFAVAGTLNILAQAGRRGWLDYFFEIRRLTDATNFRVREDVIRAAWDESSV